MSSSLLKRLRQLELSQSQETEAPSRHLTGVVGIQVLELLPAASQVHQQGTGWEVEQLELQSVLQLELCIFQAALNLLYHNSDLSLCASISSV